MLREALLLGLMGLTLTFIALTGQTFHLASNIPAAIVLWMALCTPFMLVFGRTTLSLLPWLLGGMAAIACGFHEVVETFNITDNTAALWAICFTILLPIICVYAASMTQNILPHFTPDNYALPDLLFKTGVVLFLIFVTQSTLMWYDTGGERLAFLGQNTRQFIVLGVFAVGGVLANFMPLSAQDFTKHEEKIFRYMLIIGIFIAALPVILLTQNSTVMAAISFIVFWLCVGGAAQIIGYPKLMSLAIFLVAARLYIIYIELFGSLLQTGFGLILSGGVLIALGWGAKRFHKAIEHHTEVA